MKSTPVTVQSRERPRPQTAVATEMSEHAFSMELDSEVPGLPVASASGGSKSPGASVESRGSSEARSEQGARVTFSLKGVVDGDAANGVWGADDRSRSGSGSALWHRPLGTFLQELGPRDQVRFVHGIARDSRGDLHYVMEIECCSLQADPAKARHRLDELTRGLAAALTGAAIGYRFEPCIDVGNLGASGFAFQVVVRPHGIASEAPAAGRLHPTPRRGTEASVRLPLAGAPAGCISPQLLLMLAGIGGPCEISMEFRGRRFADQECEAIREVADRLLDTSSQHVLLVSEDGVHGRASTAQVLAAHELMRWWSIDPRGVEMEVCVRSATELPIGFIRSVGQEVLGGRPFEVLGRPAGAEPHRSAWLPSYLPWGAGLPPLLPDSETAVRLGCAKDLPRWGRPVTCDGALLGQALTPFGVTPVRLSPADRAQSFYVMGRSGTGKSTFLSARIQQDIELGQGVLLVDPHGDLYSQVRSRIPKRRMADVTLLDFTDFDHCPGLNLLEHSGRHPQLNRNFVIRALSQVFHKLYANVPESMGPNFQLYMRNSVALAMEDPDGMSNLSDIPRLLHDDLYREYLLSHCRDREVRDFWVGVAHRAGGEFDLKNLAPWIINKFTEFTSNALVRQVVCQARSTFDFRRAMDEGQIVLVNLAKGVLGEPDSQFLGMLLTNSLLGAALSRAGCDPGARLPFNVYIDEFHGLTTLSALELLLAEARKYGITVTLAHQNLAQLPDRSAQTVLANTGSFVFFRLGVQDAQVLAPHVGGQLSANDLAALPDFHAVMQVKASGVPGRPMVVRTELPPAAPRGSYADPDQLVARSRQTYCTSAERVDRSSEQRKVAYLGRMKLSDLRLSAQLLGVLKEKRAETLHDVLKWPAADRVALGIAASTIRDRQVLRSLESLRLREPGQEPTPVETSESAGAGIPGTN